MHAIQLRDFPLLKTRYDESKGGSVVEYMAESGIYEITLMFYAYPDLPEANKLSLKVRRNTRPGDTPLFINDGFLQVGKDECLFAPNNDGMGIGGNLQKRIKYEELWHGFNEHTPEVFQALAALEKAESAGLRLVGRSRQERVPLTSKHILGLRQAFSAYRLLGGAIPIEKPRLRIK